MNRYLYSRPLPLAAFLLLPLLLSFCRPKQAPAHQDENTLDSIRTTGIVTYPKDFVSFINHSSPWVDSVFNSLSPRERLAQLMIVEAYSNRDKKYEEDLLMLVKEYKVGGIIFFQGGPVRQARLTNRLQQAAKVPLLISMDAESGVGMRLDSCVLYPLPQLLGAMPDDSLVYRLGAETADEFRRLGMHLNFAPVADVNNNPLNPIISYRAFGEDKKLVSRRSRLYARGMQDRGIIATAKHFPGHGDTDVDSHFALPVIKHGRARLDSIELYPFRELIAEGVGGIMVAHMNLPQLDPTPNLPSTLSKPIVTGLLKKELGYNGLIITDAMVMKGVLDHAKPGEAEVRALEAGCEILERLESVPKALEAIEEAISKGRLSRKELDRRCRKVLAAKFWAELDNYRPVKLANLQQELNPDRAARLNQTLADASITLLHQKGKSLPISGRKWLRKQRIAVVAMGVSRPTLFQNELHQELNSTSFHLPRRSNTRTLKALEKKLRNFDQVVIGIYGPDIRPSNRLGFTAEETAFVQRQAKRDKSVVVLFENAYTLAQFPGIGQASALLVAYQKLPATDRAAAKVLTGKLQPIGRLPVSVPDLL